MDGQHRTLKLRDGNRFTDSVRAAVSVARGATDGLGEPFDLVLALLGLLWAACGRYTGGHLAENLV